jgi:nucleoside-triphosphatase THEP1
MVLVLSGPVHAGKTTFLERALPLWAGRGLELRGFLSPAVSDASGAQGYDLVEIGTGRRLPYLRREGEPDAERIGPYAFVAATLERARSILRGAGPPGGVLVVDEVGPCELRGGGIWPALSEALRRTDTILLLVAREEILPELAAALAPAVPVVLDLREPGLLGRVETFLFGRAAPDDRQG